MLLDKQFTFSEEVYKVQKNFACWMKLNQINFVEVGLDVSLSSFDFHLKHKVTWNFTFQT